MQDGSRWGKIGVTFISEFKLVIHPFLCHIKNALAAAAAGLFSVDFTVLHAKWAHDKSHLQVPTGTNRCPQVPTDANRCQQVPTGTNRYPQVPTATNKKKYTFFAFIYQF